MDLTTVLLLALIGILAGFTSGLVGVGGGIIIVPAFIFLIGMGQLEAQGTSLAVMLLPIGILAFTQYYKAGNVNIPAAFVVVLTFVVGGYFGAKAAQKIDVNLVKLIFGVLMILAAFKMIANGWKFFSN